MTHVIRVIAKSSGEIVEEIDVSGETETGVAQIKNGLRTQLNHDDYRLEEARA